MEWNKVRNPIGNSMKIGFPIYHPHSPSVFILFVVVFVVWESPNDDWIRFHLLSHHHIFKFCSYPFVHHFWSNQLSMSFWWHWMWTDIMYLKCEILHICIFDISPMLYNLLSVEFGPSWTKYCVTKLLLQERWPPRHLQENPKLGVFFTGALTYINMNKRTANH